jgi:hypothetical protein
MEDNMNKPSVDVNVHYHKEEFQVTSIHHYSEGHGGDSESGDRTPYVTFDIGGVSHFVRDSKGLITAGTKLIELGVKLGGMQCQATSGEKKDTTGTESTTQPETSEKDCESMGGSMYASTKKSSEKFESTAPLD